MANRPRDLTDRRPDIGLIQDCQKLIDPARAKLDHAFHTSVRARRQVHRAEAVVRRLRILLRVDSSQ